MDSEVGVFVVHGIGVQQPGFANDFILKIESQLNSLGVRQGTIAWQTGYWADLLNKHEEELWTELSRANDLDWVAARRILINVFADAIAYRRVPGQEHDMYSAIHRRIRDRLAALRASLNHRDRPLIVIAHSLGSVIMSNYIWDEQKKRKHLGNNPFESMETLTGMVTFGSTIPLFTLALPEVINVDFPPVKLPGNLRKSAKWLNFFDADDVLGYPLKPLSRSYAETVNEDVEINVGGWLTSWNPFSHTKYWTDTDFIEPVSRLMHDVVLASQAGA